MGRWIAKRRILGSATDTRADFWPGAGARLFARRLAGGSPTMRWKNGRSGREMLLSQRWTGHVEGQLAAPPIEARVPGRF